LQPCFNGPSIRTVQQKQTLNEVENLYFHHYRARIPPKGTQKPEKGIASISSQVTSVPSAAAPNSASTANPAPAIDTCTGQKQGQLSQDTDHAITGTVAGGENSSAMELDPPPEQEGTSVAQTEQAASDIQPSQPHSPVPKSPAAIPPSLHPPASPSKPSQPPLKPSPASHIRHHSTQSPVSHSLPSSPLASVSLPLSRNLPLTKHSSLPQSATPRSRGPTPAIQLSHSTPPPSMPGSSNVALTYDSFWSSHSTTSSNYRSTMTSSASYQSVNNGDTDTALSNLETSYAFSMGAPNPSFEPLPLQKQRSLARNPTVTALRQSYNSRSTGDG
jgi:hypothetical protein